MWLCATLQPVMGDRPHGVRAFLSSGGIPILCRQLAAGPGDVAVHACGVLTAALRHDNGVLEGETAAEAAAEVRVMGVFDAHARARVKFLLFCCCRA